MERHEPYVADPAEPADPRPFARWQTLVVTMAVVILLIAAATVFLQGRGEEDPALTVPREQNQQE